MSGKFAVLAGLGNLSDEVIALADDLDEKHVRFTIAPWFAVTSLVSEPIRTLNRWFLTQPRFIHLNPFRFSEIEDRLKEFDVDRVYFTGDFPQDRYLQLFYTQVRGYDITSVADEKLVKYFNATPERLSASVRYFVALQRLFTDLGVRPILAADIFPTLNPTVGENSNIETPPTILNALDSVIVDLARSLEQAERTRLSQAAVVVRNIVRTIETKGTNDLLDRFAKGNQNRELSYLLKVPSAEFDPSLDQPTIGVATIRKCSKAGIKGIVVCAETTVVAERAQTLAALNEAGMFLYALPFKQLQALYSQHIPDTWVQNDPTKSQDRR